MFSRTSGPGLRALFFVSLSIFLLILNQHSIRVHLWQSKVTSVVAFPFQWTVDLPIRFARWMNHQFTTQQSLLVENEKLREEEMLFQVRLQKLLALENENAELRELLQSQSHTETHMRVARLLAVSLDPDMQQMVIDQGEKNDVAVGQPVLDADGLMGQVIEVGPLTSKILLITDARSAVPVVDVRDREHAVAMGLGSSGQLQLINVPEITQIQTGDQFVTSGLDMRYPAGYPVGIVSDIQYDKNNHRRDIILSPNAKIDRAEHVLLVSSHKNALRQIVKKQVKEKLPHILLVKP